MAARRSAPEHIPGYRELTRVGHGGFSVVYRAHSERLNRDVAVKVLSATLGEDDRATDRFHREIELVNRLSGHPNVVGVLDAGIAESGRPYLVMDYYAGGSLKALLSRTGPLPVPDALALIGTIARALAAAHEAGVLHRDIKPENILISQHNEPALADFGIGRFTDRLSTGTSARTDAVTLQHVAPEVLNGERSSVASDIYSLGSTLYELLDGRPPFCSDTDEGIAPMLLRILNDEPPTPRRADLASEVVALLHRALAKPPEDRFHTAAAFAAALRDVAALPAAPTTAASTAESSTAESLSSTESLPTKASSLATDTTLAAPPAVVPAQTLLRADRLAVPAPPPPRPRRGSHWRWAIVAAVVLAVIAGTGVAFVVTRQPAAAPRAQPAMNAQTLSGDGDTSAVGTTDATSPSPTTTSAPATTTTTQPAATAPPAPSGLTVTAVDQHTIRISWQDDSGGQARTQIDNGDTAITVAAGVTSHDWGGLAASTYMCFKIRAMSSAGLFSDYVPSSSPYYVCATTPASPPSSPAAAPSNLTVTAIDANTIQLAWTDNSGGLAQFEINNGDTSVDVGTGTTSYDWGGLAPNTYMCFKIRAYDGVGDVSGYVPSVSPYYVCTTTPG